MLVPGSSAGFQPGTRQDSPGQPQLLAMGLPRELRWWLGWRGEAEPGDTGRGTGRDALLHRGWGGGIEQERPPRCHHRSDTIRGGGFRSDTSLQDGASSWEKEMPLPLPCAHGEGAAVPTPAPTAPRGLVLHPLGYPNQSTHSAQGSPCSSPRIRGLVPPWLGQQGWPRPPAYLTEASPAHQQLL